MCHHDALPAYPPKAQLYLPSYPHPHSHTRKGFHNHYDAHAQTMDPPPATSTSLTDFCFLQEEDDDDEQEWVDDCESDTDCSTPPHPLLFPEDQLRRILQGVCSCRTQLEATLLTHVTEALRILALSAQNEGHRNNSNLRRFVMSNLRCAGYNAGICKSRWEQTNGYPAGDYEFIDVIVGAKGRDRVLVDIDFRAQFEIARPTPEYAALVEVLPHLLVGTVDKLRDIIRIMCDAAKRSLKARGMHLPPWRKKRYLEAKWMGSQKRTTQFVPSQGVEWNACFLYQKNIGSGVTGKGEIPGRRISGLGRALAQAVTHNNTNDVY